MAVFPQTEAFTASSGTNILTKKSAGFEPNNVGCCEDPRWKRGYIFSYVPEIE